MDGTTTQLMTMRKDLRIASMAYVRAFGGATKYAERRGGTNKAWFAGQPKYRIGSPFLLWTVGPRQGCLRPLCRPGDPAVVVDYPDSLSLLLGWLRAPINAYGQMWEAGPTSSRSWVPFLLTSSIASTRSARRCPIVSRGLSEFVPHHRTFFTSSLNSVLRRWVYRG